MPTFPQPVIVLQRLLIGGILAATSLALLRAQNGEVPGLWHHRNLGKAFYENTTTLDKAVEEFRQALALSPDSGREHVNYGIALIRAGKVDEGVAQLEATQKRFPGIPHTWFNLGVEYKKAQRFEEAIIQFEGMLALVPDEPISHYNLGLLFRLTDRNEESVVRFEEAARLDPNLAAPHFQLAHMYRRAGRLEDSKREQSLFQELKRAQRGAAIPEDLDWSDFAEIYDDPSSLEIADAGPSEPILRPWTGSPVQAPRASRVLLSVDLHGDGKPEILLGREAEILVLSPDGDSPPLTVPPLNGLVIDLEAGDFNNDDKPDLCVVTDEAVYLLQNDGSSFQELHHSIEQSFTRGLLLDFDHDDDLDLFLLGDRAVLARNEGPKGFRELTGVFPFQEGHVVDAALFDRTKDRNGFDLVVSFRDRPGGFYRDLLRGNFQWVGVPEIPSGAELTARDMDNDGWTDIIVSSSTGVGVLFNDRLDFRAVQVSPFVGSPVLPVDLANRGGADLLIGNELFRNRGLRRFADGVNLGLEFESRAWESIELDGDGRIDLASLDERGMLRPLRNETQTSNRWIRVSLEGVKNPKSAVGAEVEVKAGSSYQKQTYAGVPLHFGIGAHDKVDTARITWPNGLIQNEPEQAAGKAYRYREKQQLSGSCPMVFTWNGEEFEFVGDVLGVAPLGARSGESGFFEPDHDEYIQIEGGQLKARDGFYEVRMTEELREVAYLDQIRLIALDHPAEIEIFTNEKFKSRPFPEHRLFGVNERIVPRRAVDHRGKDVRDSILARDSRTVDGFAREADGSAQPHWIELDLGRNALPDNRGILVLHGWVDWSDGSTFRRISQEVSSSPMPQLQVRDLRGEWMTVVADMGIPAGKPKSIVVDLTGLFRSSSREIRVVTSLSVYWDEIFAAAETGDFELEETAASAYSSVLDYRGFSKPIIEWLQPERFDYSTRIPISLWNPTPGDYTRFGHVEELLADVDDRFVIMGAGDELRLLFEAAEFPPLKPGWKRDFLLFVDGWAKDGDPNTAFGDSVEPLPFHGMSSYPELSEEDFPDDSRHRSYREKYNTRPALRIIRSLAPPTPD